MASKIGGGHDEPISEINIVPFVDIILVVLIIFMVTTPFVLKPSININLPKAASGDETAPTALNIAIDSNGSITLNGDAVTEEDISKFSTVVTQKAPDTQAVISADRAVPHGRVIGILDIVKAAGIKKFAISIDKK